MVTQAWERADAMLVQAIDLWTTGPDGCPQHPFACLGGSRMAHSLRRGPCRETTGKGQGAVAESREHSWA